MNMSQIYSRWSITEILKFVTLLPTKKAHLYQRFGGKLQDDSTICEGRRSKYGKAFQGFTKLKYSAHGDSKTKLS